MEEKLIYTGGLIDGIMDREDIELKGKYANNPTFVKYGVNVTGKYTSKIVKVAIGLSGFAQTLFLLAIEQLVDNSEGAIVLDSKRLCDKFRKTEKTFYNAINNLIECEVLIQSDRKNLYWINYKLIKELI